MDKAVEVLSKPIHVLGIKFAPVVLPLERRLQTLVAAYWIACIPLLTILSAVTLVWLLLFTILKWIPILYATWVLYDFQSPYIGGWRNTWMRQSRFGKYMADYFPIKLVKTADLDPQKTHIICNHPHGVLCAGAFTSFATNQVGFPGLFPGFITRLVTLPIQFFVPIHRDLLLASGACASTKDSVEHLMRVPKGLVIVLIPGGAAEATYAGDADVVRLVLNRRKGFVKLALKHGVNLVPSFSFGENYILEQYKGWPIAGFQTLVKKYLGFIPVLVCGRGVFQYNFGFIPHRRGITVVVGEAIIVEKTENPTNEQVDGLHQRYVKALRKLYNDNKAKYGSADRDLVIVE